jgi:choice-of-anchor B domain-containing protein
MITINKILKTLLITTTFVLSISLIISCSDDNDDDIIDPDNKALNSCENGMAGIYPCNEYDLMGHIPVNILAGPGEQANDSWGWTDSTTGKEYALVGTTAGTTFIDISDTQNLILIGMLPTATVKSSWRDIKVFNNYAFIVSEAAGHGMQVFDLTKLRNSSNSPVIFGADAHYTGFGNAHNIVINEDSGYAYAVGTSTFSGGPHFIDIRNPINPVAAGGFEEYGYSHDGQVVTYSGSDSDYVGHEIFVGSNEDGVVIVDVSDKDDPIGIITFSYNDIGYTHQGWFTDDLKYFIVGDEVDEINRGFNTRTLIFDFTDLDQPSLHKIYSGPTGAIDHNGYVNGSIFYLANYTAGVRFIDISDISNGSLREVGFFDTYINNNSTNFNGAWNVYPYFKSGNILISDIEGGLFIVRKSGT